MNSSDNNSTDIAIHRAVQYLATFAKNYVEERSDDSHTNLTWNTDSHCYESRANSEGVQLILNCEEFQLQWRGNRALKLSLTGRSHSEVIVWMHHSAVQNGLGEYEFHLHYRLDSGPIPHDFIYPELDHQRLSELNLMRDRAMKSLLEAREYFDFETEIRTWPHHFDTGGYSQKGDVGIGFGLAIPDETVDDHYLYVTGYKGKSGISTEAFPLLTDGEWRNGDIKGAVLKVNGLEDKDWILFFKEAIFTILEKSK